MGTVINMKNPILFIFLGAVLASMLFAEPTGIRSWHSTAGTTIEAAAVDVHGGRVSLKTESGRQIKVPLEKFTEEDQKTLMQHFGIKMPKPGEPVTNAFIYLNTDRLEKVRMRIKQKNPYFTDAYQKLLAAADGELDKPANPVTRKTLTPPSGDKHDYLSIAPYRWPNPNTEDGSPWLKKDGQVNPMSRGDDTDKVRLTNMFNRLQKLSLAYYFSGEDAYAEKARSVLRIWFVDDATKVNPNINYGQGIPGELEGRLAGIIEWTQISKVVSAIQILSQGGILREDELQVINAWISDYYHWLKTHPFGIEVDRGRQNHATHYDYQMVGLARYLGLNVEAKERLKAAKNKRIKTQIKPDGTQPGEIRRTKSVNYCSMNLMKMAMVAELGKPLGVDLWNYSSEDGRSMRKAFEFLRPYAQGDEPWAHKQLGGAERAIEKKMKPLFSKSSTIFGEALIDDLSQCDQSLDYLSILLYPPLNR